MSTDPLLMAPEVAPSLVGAALRMGAMVLLLIGGAVAWAYWQRRGRTSQRRLEILDRVPLTRGASVALLRVDGVRLVVGVSTEGVRLIRELEDERLEEAPSDPERFPRVLARAATPGGASR